MFRTNLLVGYSILSLSLFIVNGIAPVESSFVVPGRKTAVTSTGGAPNSRRTVAFHSLSSQWRRPRVVVINPPFTNPHLFSSANNNDYRQHFNDNEEYDDWLDLHWKGVTVSPHGFLVLFQTVSTSSSTTCTVNESSTAVSTTTTITALPIRVSTSDVSSAASIEALTVLQLVNRIDMAGTAFPPNLLSSLCALWCTSNATSFMDTASPATMRKNHSTLVAEGESPNAAFTMADPNDHEKTVRNILQKTIESQLGTTIPYEEATAWQKNQIRFPPIQLSRVRLSLPPLLSSVSSSILSSSSSSSTNNSTSINIIYPNFLPFQFHLECTLQPNATTPSLTFSIPLFSEPLSNATTTRSSDSDLFPGNTNSIPLEDLDIYGIIHPSTSAAFLSLALALRYRVPVVISKPQMMQLLQQHDSHKNKDSNDNYLQPTIPGSYDPIIINTEIRNVREVGYDDQLLKVYFPKWQSMYSLHSINDRVTTAFANNFEQSRLEMALKVALDRGDAAAADRIRRSISLLSSQQQLQNEFLTIDTNTISSNSYDEEVKERNYSDNLDDEHFSFQ